MSTYRLKNLLSPRSVALVGASPRYGSVGWAILSSICKAQFKGKFAVVNPRHAEIDGVATVGSLGKLPFAPELVVITAPGALLSLEQREDPSPGPDSVRVQVSDRRVCRTDLHVVDGELPGICYQIVPGHAVVGRVEALGPGVTAHKIGECVDVPWLGYTCGKCSLCKRGEESLCDRPLFTCYTRDGGFATHLVADARYCFPLGEAGNDVAMGPLLCAGLIGWCSLVMAGEEKRLGIFGFGAAGRIVAQMARWQGRSVYAFTRTGDVEAQGLVRSLGACWAGWAEEQPPVPPDAAILYAPVGALVPLALRAVRKGGRVVCAGIHMSVFPSFLYDILGEERQLLSIANLTRNDGIEFFKAAARAGIKTHTTVGPLRDANEVLSKLRSGQITGTAVLRP